MVCINKDKIKAHLHENFIDVEKLCNKMQINRMSFYIYLANKQMPKNVYLKLCKVLDKDEKEFINVL